ncbi:MAG TPA: hypothetical protein VFK05_25640 [Polyangiaceae bacterium]|nr:hypothetical protein [Polyangiaceae bacterium]
MSFGVTTTGFVVKTFQDIQSGIFAYWRGKISRYLKLDEKTGLGNVGNGAADQIAQVWEAIQGAYYAFDILNADDDSIVALCELTGTIRRGAKNGFWSSTCNLDASKTYAPGDLVANVAGQASNRWQNRDPITTTAAGNYAVTFISQTAGAAAVGVAGSLVIAQPIDGWNSVTTAVNATAGEDIETIEELLIRREQELQGAGSATLAAVRAKVSKVPGVISVRAVENKKDVPDIVNGVPPKAYRLVIWDGVSPAALNDDVAAAILSAGPAGIQSVGSSSGNAVDDVGDTQTIPFDRAAQVPIYVTCTVKGGASADIKAAIIKAGGSLTSGNSVIAEKIRAAITNAPGVTDLTAFAIGTSAGPVSAVNIPIPITSIGLFDKDRIVVTFV